MGTSPFHNPLVENQVVWLETTCPFHVLLCYLGYSVIWRCLTRMWLFPVFYVRMTSTLWDQGKNDASEALCSELSSVAHFKWLWLENDREGLSLLVRTWKFQLSQNIRLLREVGGKICVARLKLHLLSTKGKEITLDFKYSLSFQALSQLFRSQALQCNECCLLFVFEQCPVYWHSTLPRVFCPLTKEQQRASNNTREWSKSQAWEFSKKSLPPFWRMCQPMMTNNDCHANVTECRV